MTEEVVVDTNVAVVANGDHDGADDACLSRCVAELGRIQLDCRLWLDDDWLILREYLKYLDPRGLAGPGDAFIKWVLNNQGNEAHIGRIAITPDTEREFRRVSQRSASLPRSTETTASLSPSRSPAGHHHRS